MADIQILGGNTDTRSQIKNLWASVNKISNYINTGGGTGNVNYSGTGSIGSHYVQSSSDGKTCGDSKLSEDATNFDFGGLNVSSVSDITATNFIKNGGSSNDFLKGDGSSDSNAYLTPSDLLNYVPKFGDSTISGNLTADSFIKNGGTNIQYLMSDGSSLTYSSNSGNSNYYIFLNGTSGSPTPADGYITYNHPSQSPATIIYISHLTSDGIDIEVFFKQLTTLSEVYIQDKGISGNFLQFNITGTPTITAGQKVSIPVAIRTATVGGFAEGTQIMVSFFTNSLEVDTRLSAVENKTQYQIVQSGSTRFSSNIDLLNTNQLTNVSKMTTSNGTFNVGYNNTDSYISTSINIACGNNNSITNNDQIIFGVNNSIISNQTLVVGRNNTNINTGLGNVIGRSNTVSAPAYVQCFGTSNTIGSSGYYNVCIGSSNSVNANYASAIGSDITNNTPNSVCLGNSAISTIYPNSAVCDLGNSTTPFKDIYYSGEIKATGTSKLDLQSINSFFMGIMFQNGSGLLTTMSNSLWSALGSSSSATSSYAVTNNFTRQLCCALWTTTALADGAQCGYVSTSVSGIQVSTGFQWGLLSALGIADSAYNANNCQNFWGLWNVATGIVLNQTTQLSVQRNMICFGSNTTDANICIYTAGALNTVKQVDLGASFPSNRTSGALSTNFYRFSFYWDGTKIYYKAINTTLNITVQGSFTPLSTDMPLSTISLYPQCVRVMGTPQSNGQARLQVQRFGVFY